MNKDVLTTVGRTLRTKQTLTGVFKIQSHPYLPEICVFPKRVKSAALPT